MTSTKKRIFIENRLYKKIETVKTLEGIHDTLDSSLKPYQRKLARAPTQEDRERLLQIPIRRISQFDINKNQEEIALLVQAHKEVEKHLRNTKKFAIDYLKGLILKFGEQYKRKTRIKAIEEIDRRAIETKEIKVGFDPETGFLGTKVSGPVHLYCTNFDKLLIFFKDGTYKALAIPEKHYFEKVAWVGIADKKTPLSVVYKNKKTAHVWAKRFIVDKFILEKLYSFIDEDSELQHISSHADASLELYFNQKEKQLYFLKEIPLKGAHTRGVRLATQKVKKIVPLK